MVVVVGRGGGGGVVILQSGLSSLWSEWRLSIRFQLSLKC